jgi:predicted TPR repeat methyltransferase
VANHVLKSAEAVRHANLGEALLDAGDVRGASESCLRALQLDRRCLAAHVTLGNVLVTQSRYEAAIECYRAALLLDPRCPAARPNLGASLYALGRHSEALAAFQEALRFEPDNPLALQMVAALGGEQAAPAAPRDYVRDLFDGYADSFDKHLVEELGYRTPELIATLLRETMGHVQPRSLDVLDLGCGTGLAGVAIAPMAHRIIGVDLAPKMLEVAARKALYERLECNDVLTMLAAEQAASFDLVLAADVFVYLGRLDEVVAEVKRVLRPGGFFAFSVEQLEGRDGAGDPASNASGGDRGSNAADYQVNTTGRYAHSADYLRRLSGPGGFALQRLIPSTLRMDKGRAIAGWIAVWNLSTPILNTAATKMSESGNTH